MGMKIDITDIPIEQTSTINDIDFEVIEQTLLDKGYLLHR